MTVVTGQVQDIGMAPLSGALIATAVEFRTSGDFVVAPESRSWPIVAGAVEVDLLPGPTRLTIQVGSHARDSFDVIVPEEPVTLARLVEDAFPWSPSVVSEVAAHRQAAEAAALAAAQSASDADGSATAAAGSASAAASSASAAGSSAGAAAGSAIDAAGSATDAATSATAADGSASAAAGSASDASQSAQGAASSASAAAGSASTAAADAGRAEAAADSFDLSVTSSTLAPGSPATVTVTGDGPAYSLAFGVPQGEKGDKGDDGEISQAQLDAAVASLVDGAPEALNTLSELSTALGDDPNFATTTATAIGERAKTSDVNAALAGKADAGAENTATWAGVSGKPSTFTPATHSHTAADTGAVARQGAATGLWIGTEASLPATGTAGVLYVTTD